MGDDPKKLGSDTPAGASSSGNASSGPSFKPSASAEKEVYKKEYGRKEWGVGDTKPKDPADASKSDGEKKPASQLPKTEVGFKALYSGQVKGEAVHVGGKDTFVSALSAKASYEALGASVNVNEMKAKATLIKGKVEGTAVHAQVDLVDLVKKLFGFDDKPKPSALPPGGFAPMAARLLDITTHGTPLAPGPGSTNVFIGGLPAWRAGIDLCACAAPGAAPHGAGPAATGEPTVLINGMPAIRVGDWVTEPTGGPNVIVVGCPTVFIGAPAGAPPEVKPPGAADDLPWILFESVASADAIAAEAEAKVAGEADLKNKKGSAEVAAGAEAVLAKASIPLKVRVLIPFTTYYLGLGVTAGAQIGAGAKAGASAKINQDGKPLDFSAGASATLGGGLSAKLSIDVAKK